MASTHKQVKQIGIHHYIEKYLLSHLLWATNNFRQEQITGQIIPYPLGFTF